ncbi:MAG TPA: hypothetical protein P5055_13495, partial [Candidatus Paceibacterota bacterium]|nr:hypothetical protein [Candidatus Paceibacterota bacterium]
LQWTVFIASLWLLRAEQWLQHDFTNDPVRQGWKYHGDSSLFSWESVAGRMAVTWDSSHSNSYFYLPLMTVLGRTDSFELGFDLELENVLAGVGPGKPFAFELAVGFLNINQAIHPAFRRGTGTDSPNLIEFDYFPDTGFGATVWPTIVDTNGAFNYGGNQDYLLLELVPGVVYRVLMRYSAESEVLSTTLTRDGIAVAPVLELRLSGRFTDFRADALAISSYSDLGAEGSILANGWIDNVSLRIPDPPVRQLELSCGENGCHVRFASLPHWRYTLERSQDLRLWEATGPSQAGAGAFLELVDPLPFDRAGFYRVRSEKESKP